MVRDYEIGYRTAHNIVHEFVLESQKRKIPATEANAELLDNAAEDILGRKLNMPEERLRELLDPEYFMKVTNSKGGIAPDEIARMIADRRGKLEEANKRHLSRIETLEDSKEEMFSELRRLNKE
jgi:argininosuccinate lyase